MRNLEQIPPEHIQWADTRSHIEKANPIFILKKTLGLAAPWSWHPKNEREGAGRQPLDRTAAVFNKTPNLPRNDLRVRDPPCLFKAHAHLTTTCPSRPGKPGVVRCRGRPWGK